MDRMLFPGFNLSEAGRLYVRSFEKRSRNVALDFAQSRALLVLAENEGVTQRRLSELTAIASPWLVRILDRLETMGLAQRHPHLVSPVERPRNASRSDSPRMFRSNGRALPKVVDAVQGRVSVFMDGGIRSGLDVLKALSLGAKACFLGRAWAYALGAAGESGVRDMLDILREELRSGMILTGCSDVNRATADLLLKD